jgi:hypothetical protein
VFQPLPVRVQRSVDRRFDRRRHAAAAATPPPPPPSPPSAGACAN